VSELDMCGVSIPADLPAFVRAHLETYEQLRVLELLGHEPASSSTEDQISDRLNLTPTLARAALDSLCRSCLVEARLENGMTRFAYAPASLHLDHSVKKLFEAYKLQPVEIIKLMSANAIERVRTAALHAFADAFVLGKDKGNG
jgi:hypothetical protein